MMDSYERQQAERAERNAAMVAELDAVCRQHGARACLVPAEAIMVVLDDGDVRVEWSWGFGARGARVNVVGRNGATHVVDHRTVARALAKMSALLADDAFEAALAIALTRTSERSARALLQAQQRRAAAQQSYVSEHGG